ncbi:MAG: hypothetical protein KAH30_07035 [Caldisericia bacterium]|nr:hypothetical protein [Caldisericia bacterium]
MGASYNYQSAKDVLKWNKVSIRDNINTVMRIGILVNMRDENFNDIVNENEFLEISKDDLDNMYKH